MRERERQLRFDLELVRRSYERRVQSLERRRQANDSTHRKHQRFTLSYHFHKSLREQDAVGRRALKLRRKQERADEKFEKQVHRFERDFE